MKTTLLIVMLVATASADPLVVRTRPIHGWLVEHSADREGCTPDVQWAVWEFVLKMPIVSVDGKTMSYRVGKEKARTADRVVDGGDQTIGYWDLTDTETVSIEMSKLEQDLSLDSPGKNPYHVMKVSLIERQRPPCYEAWEGLGLVLVLQ